MSTVAKPKKIKKKVAKPDDAHPKLDDFECELEEQAVTVENNGKIYEMSMDARGFNPEDIKVKITETSVQLEGIHETEEEIDEFYDEIDLPERTIASSVEVLMNKNGVLRIRAKIQPKEEEMRTIIVREETRTEVRKTTIRTYTCDTEIKITKISVAEGTKILADEKYEDSTNDLKIKDNKLELDLDMHGHRPEDIKVSVSDKVLAIQAVAHYDIENPPKEIHKKYLIPDGVDPCSFRSLLKKSGSLATTAEPKPEPEKKAKPEPTPQPPPPKIPAQKPGAVNEPITYCWIKSQIVENLSEIEELISKAEDITEQVAKVENKKFEAHLDVGDFKAEELRLKITKEFVIVHSETRTQKRQLYKKILLPGGVLPQNVKNKMTPKYALLSILAKVTA